MQGNMCCIQQSFGVCVLHHQSHPQRVPPTSRATAWVYKYKILMSNMLQCHPLSRLTHVNLNLNLAETERC